MGALRIGITVRFQFAVEGGFLSNILVNGGVDVIAVNSHIVGGLLVFKFIMEEGRKLVSGNTSRGGDIVAVGCFLLQLDLVRRWIPEFV